MRDDPGLRTTFQDIDGNYSSKRIAAFFAFSLFTIGFLVDTFSSFHAPDDLMRDLLTFAGAGLGLAVAERFAPQKEM